MPLPTENVVAGALLTFAAVLQGWSNRSTRKKLSDQMQNGVHDSIKRVERKVDVLGGDVSGLKIQVARLDERTKKGD